MGPDPHNTTATIQVVDGEAHPGVFLLIVGPGEMARLEFHGRADASTIDGTYFVRPENMVRTATGERSFDYTPSTEWDWLYDNPGSFEISQLATGALLRLPVRTIRYHETADGLITVALEGITDEQLDVVGHHIRPEGSVWLEITGRLMTLCRASNADGSSIDDPMMLMNPYCRIFSPG